MNILTAPILWVFLFGLLIRFYPYIVGYHFYLGEDPYFHLTKVEALSRRPVGQMLVSLISRSGNTDTFGGYPPLMHIIAATLTRVMPLSWAFVLVPSLFGAGSGVLVYLIANEIFLEKTVGVLAAVISLISLDSFRYSASNFMPQTLGAFLSLCIVCASVRVTKRKRIDAWFISLVCLWVLLILSYTSYFVLFGFIICMSWVIIGYREQDYFMAWYSVMSVMASLAVSAQYLINVSYHPPSMFNVEWSASLWDVAVFPFRLGIISFLLFPLGCYHYCKRRLEYNQSQSIFLLIWSCVVLVLCFVQVLPAPNPAARYIVLLTYPVAIISAFGLYQYRAKRYYVTALIVLLILQTSCTLGVENYSMIEKMSMNEGDYNLLQYVGRTSGSLGLGKEVRLIAPPSSFIRYYLKGSGVIIDEARYMNSVQGQLLPNLGDMEYMLFRHNDKYHYKYAMEVMEGMKKRYNYMEDRGAVLVMAAIPRVSAHITPGK